MSLITVDYGNIGGGSQFEVVQTYEVTQEWDNDHTISNSKGRTLLILLADWSTSKYAYDRFDNATCVGGTLTNLGHMITSAAGNTIVAGTWYQLEVTSDTCVVSNVNKSVMYAFGIV